MADLELTPEQNRLLVEALLSACTSFQKVRDFVYLELGNDLADIATTLDQKSGAIAVVKWARAEGRLGKLSDALLADRADSPAVIAYRESLARPIVPIAPSKRAGVETGAPSMPPWARVLWAVGILGAIVYAAVNLGLIQIPGTVKASFEVGSAYIGRAPHNKRIAVVFVHGIFGAKEDTWLNSANKSTFPELLASDPEFQSQLDTFVFEYYTPKFGNAGSIVDLADQLRGELDDKRFLRIMRKSSF